MTEKSYRAIEWFDPEGTSIFYSKIEKTSSQLMPQVGGRVNRSGVMHVFKSVEDNGMLIKGYLIVDPDQSPT